KLDPQCVVCSAVSLMSDDADSKADAGAVVNFTALASCGNGSPTYEFWMLPPSGAWQLVQSWSSSNVLTWDTTDLVAGLYQFQVWARGVGSTQTYESWAAAAFTITPGAPCSGASLSFNPASPGPIDGSVTATANASCGGTPSYE